MELFHGEGQGQHYQLLLRNQGRTEVSFGLVILRVDKFMGSGFSGVVGVTPDGGGLRSGRRERNCQHIAASLRRAEKRDRRGGRRRN